MLAVFSGISAVVLGFITSALTYTGGLVTFDVADKAAIDRGISNALTNMWAGFQFILPYLGVALGVVIVISAVMFLSKRAGR